MIAARKWSDVGWTLAYVLGAAAFGASVVLEILDLFGFIDLSL